MAKDEPPTGAAELLPEDTAESKVAALYAACLEARSEALRDLHATAGRLSLALDGILAAEDPGEGDLAPILAEVWQDLDYCERIEETLRAARAARATLAWLQGERQGGGKGRS